MALGSGLLVAARAERKGNSKLALLSEGKWKSAAGCYIYFVFGLCNVIYRVFFC